MHPKPGLIATALLVAAIALPLSSPAQSLEGATAPRADEMSSANRKRVKRYVEPAPILCGAARIVRSVVRA